jgi:hypothetical protein
MFPDVVPRLTPTFRAVEQDFLTLTPVTTNTTPSSFWLRQGYSSQLVCTVSGYDFVITLFFIDTSLCILSTLDHIYNLLRPGGTWINLGPLLWTGGAQAKMELSLDEVIDAAERIGFIIDQSTYGKRRKRTVECEYTRDREMTMRWVYHAEFWVARKGE